MKNRRSVRKNAASKARLDSEERANDYAQSGERGKVSGSAR
jgi:hypothetical protein